MNFCSHCGQAVNSGSWPVKCAACGTMHYRNPKPVAVAMCPVFDGGDLVGFVGVQRGRSTGHGAGKWALPGGFGEWGEDATTSAARELEEETGLVAQGPFQAIGTAISSDGSCQLIFCLGPVVLLEDVRSATPQEGEIEAVGVVDATMELAFPTHQNMVASVMDELARTYSVGRPPRAFK